MDMDGGSRTFLTAHLPDDDKVFQQPTKGFTVIGFKCKNSIVMAILIQNTAVNTQKDHT
jgi:20S proteasome alpha/beta subunit